MVMRESVAAAGEEADDAGEHARLVVDEDGQRVGLLRAVEGVAEVVGAVAASNT
jgi:hypothetical protein